MKKFIIILCIIATSACVPPIPQDALTLNSESLKMRSLQTRIFKTKDTSAILFPAVNVLQDLSFNIDFTEKELGIVVGSKTSDATDYGEIAGKVFMTALFGTQMNWDAKQKVKASLFVTPINNQTKIRVTFQRVVWDNQDKITKLEAIEDAAIYQEFFSKVSKAVFLDEHRI